MSKRTVLMSVAAAAALVSLTLASPADAGKGMKAKGRNKSQSSDFSASGQYTGYLSDVLQLNNKSYIVAPDVTVYVVGEGPAPAGTMVFDRSVFLSGERQGDKSVVHSIILLPVVADAGGSSPSAGEVPPNTPR